MDKRTQKERVLALLKSGEIISSLDAAMLPTPIMDLPKRISEIRRDGYPVDKVKKGRATGYYMPDAVDKRELAAWAASPMYGVGA